MKHEGRLRVACALWPTKEVLCKPYLTQYSQFILSLICAAFSERNGLVAELCVLFNTMISNFLLGFNVQTNAVGDEVKRKVTREPPSQRQDGQKVHLQDQHQPTIVYR